MKELPFTKIDNSNLHPAFVEFVSSHNKNVNQFQKLIEDSESSDIPGFRWGDQTADLKSLLRIVNKKKLARLISDKSSRYYNSKLPSKESLDNILEEAIEIRNNWPPDPIESMNKVSRRIFLPNEL